MDKQLQEIINAYEEFKRYTYILKEEIQELNKYSRQELNEFSKALRQSDDFAYILEDIDKIIGQKKIEEYPQLLKAHHYFEINEMDFLSEEEKINIDNYLNQLGIGSYIYESSTAWRNLTRKFNEGTIDKIKKFLVSKGIITQCYQLADRYGNYKTISQEEVIKYTTYFLSCKNIGNLSSEELDEHLKLESELEFYIYSGFGDGEYEITLETIDKALKNKNQWVYKLIKDRDTSLDNV